MRSGIDLPALGAVVAEFVGACLGAVERLCDHECAGALAHAFRARKRSGVREPTFAKLSPKAFDDLCDFR